MNSKVKEMMVRLMNCDATAKPVAASTQTSGTYSQQTAPVVVLKNTKKHRIMMYAVKFHEYRTPRPQKNKDMPIPS